MFHEKKSHAANNQDLTAHKEELLLSAREYLAHGWSVIPLVGKRAAIPWKQFQAEAPTGDKLTEWFLGGRLQPTGVGIITGTVSGIVVVDCDTRDAVTFWRDNFPSTPFVAATGRGGIHFYYRVSGEARNRVGVLGQKIDIRGEGGYVAAPPSLHPSGIRYEWESYDQSGTLPQFDAAWVGEHTHVSESSINVEAGKVKHVVAYIARIDAVSGEGGHKATFRAACKLRDAGLSKEEALAVLSKWNETNAVPPWSEAELEHKIDSAFSSPSK